MSINVEGQNKGPNPLCNVRVVWHLYDSLGNTVGIYQGFPTPSYLGIVQTTLFNLQEKSLDLTGVLGFIVSFDFKLNEPSIIISTLTINDFYTIIILQKDTDNIVVTVVS